MILGRKKEKGGGNDIAKVMDRWNILFSYLDDCFLKENQKGKKGG
jgi:hypothetical protein